CRREAIEEGAFRVHHAQVGSEARHRVPPRQFTSVRRNGGAAPRSARATAASVSDPPRATSAPFPPAPRAGGNGALVARGGSETDAAVARADRGAAPPFRRTLVN